MFSRRELVGTFLAATGASLFFGAPLWVVGMLQRRPTTGLILYLIGGGIALGILGWAVYSWRRGATTPAEDPTRGNGILLTSVLLALVACAFMPLAGVGFVTLLLAALHELPGSIMVFQSDNPFAFFGFLASFHFTRQVAVAEEVAALAFVSGGVLTLPDRIKRYDQERRSTPDLASDKRTPDQREARRLRRFAAFLIIGGLVLAPIAYYTPLLFLVVPAGLMFFFSIPIYFASLDWDG